MGGGSKTTVNSKQGTTVDSTVNVEVQNLMDLEGLGEQLASALVAIGSMLTFQKQQEAEAQQQNAEALKKGGRWLLGIAAAIAAIWVWKKAPDKKGNKK